MADLTATFTPILTPTLGQVDKDLALSGTPTDITTNATSSSGATVTYTLPTAVDEDSPATATVGCQPPSGSTFAVGTTTVTCSATDSDDSPSTVTQTFMVTVNVDNDLALSGVPADITTSATSSSGATVTYTLPTSVDEDSPATATVACQPPSGSTFAVGTTTVTCTATDGDDSPSTVTNTFTVTVTSAGGQLEALLAEVTHLGPGHSFLAKVQGALTSFNAGNKAGACSRLAALSHEAKAQAGKHVTISQASSLVATAAGIRAVIGC
jgi:hypothetical protein